MHDGVPPRFRLVAHDLLTKTYGNHWIVLIAPHARPAQYLGLKTSGDLDDVQNRIIAWCNSIRSNPGMFKSVRQSMTKKFNTLFSIKIVISNIYYRWSKFLTILVAD